MFTQTNAPRYLLPEEKKYQGLDATWQCIYLNKLGSSSDLT
jgi:hypothetical protein